jgi:hypothetical protein
MNAHDSTDVRFLRRAIPSAAALLVFVGMVQSAGAQCNTWKDLGGGITGTQVNALVVYNNELVAAGNFTMAGTTAVSHIAHWNGSSWQPFRSGIFGTSSVVNALAFYNGQLIVAGSFTVAGTASVSNIARWNGATWFDLQGGTNNTIFALTVFNNELIVGGQFTNAGGQQAQKIAKWNGSAWSPLSTGLTGPGSMVDSLYVFNNSLIAGGIFSSAGGGGQEANNIAQWNGG